MKKFYQEIHLKKIEDIAPDFLLSKAYDELHMAFVAIAPDGNCPFGIGFPEYDAMKMSDIVDNKLGVIDLASAVLAMENKMPMMLFGLNDENSIVKAVTGGFTGTYVNAE